jgi:hypothetical protein
MHLLQIVQKDKGLKSEVFLKPRMTPTDGDKKNLSFASILKKQQPCSK